MTNYQIGSIMAFANFKLDDNLLVLDGSLVPQADYPDLVPNVPPAWIIGTDIQLPDMRETGVFGTPSVPVAGFVLGDNFVTLTEAQMPTHTHTQQPHTHGYTLTTGVPTAAGLEPTFADLTTNAPAATQPTTAINDSAGGSQPFLNVPQVLLVYWYIVAR